MFINTWDFDGFLDERGGTVLKSFAALSRSEIVGDSDDQRFHCSGFGDVLEDHKRDKMLNLDVRDAERGLR